MNLAHEASLDGLRVIILENEWLSVSILPEVGAKIVSLVDKQNGRNLLWENPRIRPQSYPIDASFDNYWCGGWDDAYPTAEGCVHMGESIPAFGELRSIAWSIDLFDADERRSIATLSAYGPISPVRAMKTILLVGQKLTMSLEILNLGPLPLDYLWGTHPAFAIETGTRLMIPARTGIVGQSNHPSLGMLGDRYHWPFADTMTDMSIVPGPSSGLYCSHYATDLEDGWFAVETRGHGIVFDFPPDVCPQLWLRLNYGGWRGHYFATVAPWTGYLVNLAQAYEAGATSTLNPGQTFSVSLRCTTYQTPENHIAALRWLRSS